MVQLMFLSKMSLLLTILMVILKEISILLFSPLVSWTGVLSSFRRMCVFPSFGNRSRVIPCWSDKCHLHCRKLVQSSGQTSFDDRDSGSRRRFQMEYVSTLFSMLTWLWEWSRQRREDIFFPSLRCWVVSSVLLGHSRLWNWTRNENVGWQRQDEQTDRTHSHWFCQLSRGFLIRRRHQRWDVPSSLFLCALEVGEQVGRHS